MRGRARGAGRRALRMPAPAAAALALAAAAAALALAVATATDAPQYGDAGPLQADMRPGPAAEPLLRPLAWITPALPEAHAAHLTVCGRAIPIFGGPYPADPRVDEIRFAVPDGTYGLGDEIDIRVSFYRPDGIAVGNLTHLLSGTGAPTFYGPINHTYIEMSIPGRSAGYLNTSGSALFFRYTVQPDDFSADLGYARDDALHAPALNSSSNLVACLLPNPGERGSLRYESDVVVDALPPYVVSVSSPGGNGTYGTGRIVNVTVVLSMPAVLAGGGAAPYLQLATTPPRNATYASGNGTDTLSFLYAVQQGDSAEDLGYAGAGALRLNGAAIRGLDGREPADPPSLPAAGSPGSLSASMDITIHGAELPVLAAAGSASDGQDGFDTLRRAHGVAAFEMGGRAYAVVASVGDNGVQLVRIHVNGTLEHADSLADGGNLSLGAAAAVDAFEMGGRTYAVTTSWGDGVQLVRIHGNGTLSAGADGSATDGQDGFDMLGGALGVDAFAIDGRTYAMVASARDNGVQLIRVHGNGTLEAVSSLADNSTLVLGGARGVKVFEAADGRTYAVVASESDGVQSVRVHGNGTLEAVSSLADNSTLVLGGARGVDVVKTDGGRTYAVVASYDDNGVQAVRVHGNGTLEAAGSLADSELALASASAVGAFEMGGRAYAAVASYDSHGVQLVRVGDEDGAVLAEGSAADGPDFSELYNAYGIDTFEMGGRMHAIVSSDNDHGVQLIRLSPASATGVSSPQAGGAYPAGYPIRAAVDFDEPVSVSGHPPSLRLDLGGGRHRTAEYLSGSGTSSLVFTYTTQPGDDPGGLDHAGAVALTTRGAITDLRATGASGAVAADLELPARGDPGSPGSLRGIEIDTVSAARVADVSSPDANGTYGRGDAVRVAVEFTGAVDVSGEPALLLETEPPRSAAYASGSGGSELTFLYTVQEGDVAADLDYAGPAALSLGGEGGAAASITGRADGRPAVLGLPYPGDPGSLGHSKDITIDWAPPYVLRVTSPDPDGVYGTGRTVAVTAVFNQAVTVDEGAAAAPAIRLATDPPRDAVYSGTGNGTAELEFWYTVQPGDSAADLGYAGAALSMEDTAAIRDLAGNVADVSIPAPGSPGSLSASKNIEVHGAALPVLAAAGWARDTPALELNGAYGVAAFELGERNDTYAIVTGYNDDGIQLARIHEGGAPQMIRGLPTALRGPIAVDVLDMGENATYAVVGLRRDNGGLELVRINETGTMQSTYLLRDNSSLELGGPRGVDAFWTAGGSAFALAASIDDDGLQLVRIYRNGILEAIDTLDIADDGALVLDGAEGVSAFRTANGTTLALVASRNSNGVQLVRVYENGTLAAVASATSADAGFGRLYGAGWVSTVRAPDGSDSTLAMVSANNGDHVQLIRVHDNGTIKAEGWAENGRHGFSLHDPAGSGFFAMGGRMYSVVTSSNDDAAQMIRVHDNGTLEAVGQAKNGRHGFVALDQPNGIDVFKTAGGRTFAVAASYDGDEMQVIRLSPPSATAVSAPMPGTTYPAGHLINITVAFDEPVRPLGPPPSLSLALDGGRTRTVEYVSGSGTNMLTFGYAVRPGDSTAGSSGSGSGVLEYVGAGALAARGIVADLRAASGAAAAAAAAADLELPSPGSPGSLGALGIRIDGIAPSVLDVSSTSAGGTYTAGSDIRIAVRFDDAVLVTGQPLLALDTEPPASAAYASGNESDTLVFLYTVRDGDAADRLGLAGRAALSADQGGASIRDAAGNDADLALPDPAQQGLTWPEIAIDAKPPAIGAAEAVSLDRIRITFDEPVASIAGADAAGWSIAGADAAGLAVESGSGISPSPSHVLTLTLGGDLPDTAPDIELSYDAEAGSIADAAGNGLPGSSGAAVGDRIRPRVDTVLIVADDRIEIAYTEPVAAPSGAYSALALDGSPRSIDRVSGDGSIAHVLEFSPAASLGASGTVAIDMPAVRDEAVPPNSLGAGDAVLDVFDSRVLQVASSRITGPDRAVVVYTRAVPAQPADYTSLVVAGQPRSVEGLAGGGTAEHTLSFSPGGAPPSATGSVAAGVQGIHGGSRALVLADGQRPGVLGAAAVSAAEIKVVLNEPVTPAGAAGWSIRGGDAEGLAVSVVSAAGESAPPSAELSLALDGELRGGTAPAGMTLLYEPARGGVADPAGNALADLDESVADGIAPAIASAAVAGPDKARVDYSEAVGAPPGAYGPVYLSTGGGPRPVTAFAGNETAAHTVAFGGAAAAPGTEGAIRIDATAVRDAAGNPLGPDADRTVRLADGQAPLPPAREGYASVERAVFTARNEATITYSDALDKPADRAENAYEQVMIAGEDGARPVTGEEGLGTAVHTVRFGGNGVTSGQGGTVLLAVGLEGSAGAGAGDGDGGPPLRFAAVQIPVAPGRILHTAILSPEQPGRAVAIEPDGFTRAVDATAAGPGARPAIDVSALAVDGGAPAAVAAMFPAEPVTLAAQFAGVGFPPGATASPMPPGGVIYLRAVPAGQYPPLGAVASALGYAGAGGLELETIVEAGGAGGVPIAFDRPVRIFLADPAGGRAFYIDGRTAETAGAAVAGDIRAIDAECASDGADAVHGQLGGAGECQIDLPGAAGGRAIYTYHLTLFGTVRVGEDVGTDRPGPASASVLQRPGGDPLRAAASYAAGQTIVVQVRFTEPVAVAMDGGGGAPYLELRTGSAGARATYSAGSGTDALEFEYAVRGGDLTERLSYAGAGALALNGSSIAAAVSRAPAMVGLPEPGAPGSLSHASQPAVRIDPEPGRPVLDVGILDDGAASGHASMAAVEAAYAFNERQGRAAGALIVNATVYDAGGGAAGPTAAAALRAAHAGGAGPYVYVGPSTDRGLHAAMPYAAANNIVLVSAGSTAPSLAVEGDWTFRLLPGGLLEAEALARLARGAGAASMHAVLENATHGPPVSAGQFLYDARPPPPGRFSHAFGAALEYAGVPPLSGTVSLGGSPGSYEAVAAAEALDASVRSAGRAPAAVVYMGSPQGLAALAESSAARYPALASATWLATGPSAGSSLLAGGGTAASFAAQSGLSAARWSSPSNDAAREVDSLLPPGADPGARHRAYAAHDAMLVIGAAAHDALAMSRARDGAAPGAAAVAARIPNAAAEHDGALGDIALDYAGDMWVPARYDLWTVSRGSGGGPEWSQQPGVLDEERACSITLARAKIDYGPIDAGQTSRPHQQTIQNTGQLPFASVDLSATPWHVDSPGACAPGDSPSLPVGLSEIRTEPGGQFTDLAGSGTVLAQGLGAGGQAPLWYRLSLTGYADLPQAQITQCATYVVRCG